ncbi:hypothetical protein GCM10010413_25300 [Promicromonospora sukumoe]|uniref:EfeO-type cupredoxin-like domain-containing protein n=1 Tax=Promicromonospora sukumoe TaxID=88382 RepID=A0A7W3J8V7_9MICO|nr:hypothetical protein [Promicromonospora sukumoe]MBA8808254.1 hypothetical protein [Promicromonospora sukumoe]
MTRTTTPLLLARAAAAAVAAVTVAGVLAGCAAAGPAAGSADAPPAEASASDTAHQDHHEAGICTDDPATDDPATGEPPVEVEVRFADGRVEPAPGRVEVPLGSTVVLRAEVDAPAEIHVHGYDVAAEAAPGDPVCLEVLADTPGVFDVEAHPETLLLQLAVR